MKDCCIVIPIYKQKLNDFEIKSLIQCVNILGKDYDIYLVCAFNMQLHVYYQLTNCYNFYIYNIDEHYFKNVNTYSELCTSSFFYEHFINDYKYMLIYQLDAYVFKNDLKYFIDLDYDYYGPPMDYCTQHNPMTTANINLFYNMFNVMPIEKAKEILNISLIVGNGGFSLRKIVSINNVCKKYGPFTLAKSDYLYCGDGAPFPQNYEDRFFSELHKNELNICPVNIAIKFGFEKYQRLIFKANNNEIPFGCHNPLYFKKDSDIEYIKKLIDI